jgi:hypothetical protein
MLFLEVSRSYRNARANWALLKVSEYNGGQSLEGVDVPSRAHGLDIAALQRFHCCHIRRLRRRKRSYAPAQLDS